MTGHPGAGSQPEGNVQRSEAMPGRGSSDEAGMFARLSRLHSEVQRSQEEEDEEMERLGASEEARDAEEEGLSAPGADAMGSAGQGEVH